MATCGHLEKAEQVNRPSFSAIKAGLILGLCKSPFSILFMFSLFSGSLVFCYLLFAPFGRVQELAGRVLFRGFQVKTWRLSLVLINCLFVFESRAEVRSLSPQLAVKFSGRALCCSKMF